MRTTVAITLLVLICFVVADISDEIIHKRRTNFNKLSEVEKKEKMKTLSTKYLKRYPNTSAKKVSDFLGAQYFSNLTTKKVSEIYFSTFKKNDRESCYNKCALDHTLCTTRCIMSPDRKKCEEACDLAIKACNKICNDKYPYIEIKTKENNIVVRKFKDYEVYFNIERAHAINSTQWGWIENPGKKQK